MQPQPNEHHQWLKQIVGNWTCKASCDCGPDQPKLESEVKETVRMLGDLWVVGEGQGTVPDGQGGTMTMQSIIIIGYDPAQDRYVGSFNANCMTHQFHYNGTRTGNTLTLDTRGPHWEDGSKLVDYQDIVELVSPNERRLRSQMKGDDGNWVEFMLATYKRV